MMTLAHPFDFVIWLAGRLAHPGPHAQPVTVALLAAPRLGGASADPAIDMLEQKKPA
jgi:hypothetical protein